MNKKLLCAFAGVSSLLCVSAFANNGVVRQSRSYGANSVTVTAAFGPVLDGGYPNSDLPHNGSGVVVPGETIYYGGATSGSDGTSLFHFAVNYQHRLSQKLQVGGLLGYAGGLFRTYKYAPGGGGKTGVPALPTAKVAVKQSYIDLLATADFHFNRRISAGFGAGVAYVMQNVSGSNLNNAAIVLPALNTNKSKNGVLPAVRVNVAYNFTSSFFANVAYEHLFGKSYSDWIKVDPSKVFGISSLTFGVGYTFKSF